MVQWLKKKNPVVTQRPSLINAWHRDLPHSRIIWKGSSLANTLQRNSPHCWKLHTGIPHTDWCYTQGVSLLTDACFFSIYFVVRFMLFVILDVSHFAKKCAFRFSAAYFWLNTGKLFLYLHNDNIVILFVMFVFVLFYIPFQLCYL